jgi:hypothetical protein
LTGGAEAPPPKAAAGVIVLSDGARSIPGGRGPLASVVTIMPASVKCLRAADCKSAGVRESSVRKYAFTVSYERRYDAYAATTVAIRSVLSRVRPNA